MALTRVSTAMFNTAAQTSDLNIDANTLVVDVSTNRVGIGTTTPSVPLEVSGQLKAGGILFPTSDGSAGQALVTDGSGTASFATVAPTAGTGVTVSGTTVAIGQAVSTSSNVTFNDVVVAGTLTINGATNTNSATNTTIEDLLIELGTGTTGSPANDAGLVLERGSSANVFIGWDESSDTFTAGTGTFTGASSGNLSITPATAVFGGLIVDTSTLVVDASNNRVGIGNASPDVALDIGSLTDAVHMPVGTTAQRPSGAAGYLRYNSTLGKFEGYTTAWGEIGGGGANTFTTNVYTTSNASTTAFTLSQSVADVNDLIVFVDGVFQVPTAAYTVSGTTLTLTAAPASGRKVVAYSVNHMVSGSNLVQNSFTANGSAVAFTLSTAPVNENNTQVFLDGVYQHKATYATSGTTLTFDAAPASGVAIEVMVFTQTSINVPVDNTITTAKIVDDAVTAAKIVDNIALPGNITTTGTFIPTGKITADAGIDIDNINIDGTTIALSSGDLTLDVAGKLLLSNDNNGEVQFLDGTLHYGTLLEDNSNFVIRSIVDNEDILFQGYDATNLITALTLDMSDAGAATFNSTISSGAISSSASITASGNSNNFGNTTISNLSATTVATSGSITASGNSNSFGTTTMDGLTVSSDTNGDPVLAHFYNVSTGAAAEATAYITNSATSSDGLFLQATGPSFTTTGGFVQDAAVLGSGTGASGGLSLMTRANADMRFYTNGHTNERMRIDASGNITQTGANSADFLIKAPTDNASLTLQAGASDSGAEGAFVNFLQNTTSKWQMGMNTDNSFRWYNYAASIEAMRIASDSNVEMRGSANVRISLGTTGGSGANNASNWIRGNSGYLQFNSASSGYNWEITGATKMTLNPSGNLAVEGTLQVDGSAHIISQRTTGSGTDAGPAVPVFGRFDIRDPEPYADSVNGFARFGFTSYALNNTSPYADSFILNSYTDGSGGATNMFLINKNGAGVKIARGAWNSTTHYKDGSIYTLDYTSASDERVKENVLDITGALTAVMSLRPVTFEWTDDYIAAGNSKNQAENVYDTADDGTATLRIPDTKTTNVGFIAQEVEQVIPTVVHQDNVRLSTMDEDDFLKNINYEKLVPHLVAAIQELKEELNTATARITELENN